MSIPTGSQVISGIETTNYSYLIGDSNNNPLTNTWNYNNWVSNGMPKYNYEYVNVSEQSLTNIIKALPERNNTTTTIFQDYPNLLSQNNKCDISINEVENDIYVTFIDEGAGYNNSFGYFFYIIDNGVKKILKNSNDNNGSSYYNPTIIFPNASRKNGGNLRSGGPLVPGVKRKLKGNMSNGKFKNINVGFFLVPNAWKGTSTGVGYDNKQILYSSRELNPNYVENSNLITQNGIQTILFSDGGEFYICFEDIKRPGGDSDFNDLIIKVETSISIDTENIIELPQEIIPSNIIKYDYFGSYLNTLLSNFPNRLNSNRKYKLKRKIRFNTKKNKDAYIRSLNFLIHKLEYNIDIIDDFNMNLIYKFTKTDIDNNNDNEKTKIYTMKKEDNEDDETIVDEVYQKTKYDHLVNIQHNENDNIIRNDIEILETDENYENENRIINETNTSPSNLTRNAMAWGDPHINLLNGKSIMVPNEDMTYTFLKANKITLNMDCQLFRNHKQIEYRNTAFIKYMEFIYENNNIIIELFDNLDIFIKNENKLKNIENYKTDEIIIYNINEIPKTSNYINYLIKFLNLLSSDPDLKVRLCTFKKNNFTIMCIMYSNKPEHYNEIYINNKSLNMLTNIDGLVVEGHPDKYKIDKLLYNI